MTDDGENRNQETHPRPEQPPGEKADEVPGDGDDAFGGDDGSPDGEGSPSVTNGGASTPPPNGEQRGNTSPQPDGREQSQAEAHRLRDTSGGNSAIRQETTSDTQKTSKESRDYTQQAPSWLNLNQGEDVLYVTHPHILQYLGWYALGVSFIALGIAQFLGIWLVRDIINVFGYDTALILLGMTAVGVVITVGAYVSREYTYYVFTTHRVKVRLGFFDRNRDPLHHPDVKDHESREPFSLRVIAWFARRRLIDRLTPARKRSTGPTGKSYTIGHLRIATAATAFDEMRLSYVPYVRDAATILDQYKMSHHDHSRGGQSDHHDDPQGGSQPRQRRPQTRGEHRRERHSGRAPTKTSAEMTTSGEQTTADSGVDTGPSYPDQ